MRPLLIIFIAIIYLHTPVTAQQPKNILFIGNTITSSNDMPQTLQKMFDDKKIKTRVDQVTVPGMLLANHYTTMEGQGRKATPGELTSAIAKILSADWDMVILQDSPGPLLIPEERRCYEIAVTKFDSLIKIKNGKTVLFQNFSLRDYPFLICHPTDVPMYMSEGLTTYPDLGKRQSVCADSFNTSNLQCTALANVIKNTAGTINARIAPIGYAFEACKKKYPKIELYAKNNNPSPQGSYLISCVFFRFITGQKVSSIKYTAGIDKKQAKKIRKLVDAMSFD